MKNPEQQLPGGNDLFLINFAASLDLSRTQRAVVDRVDGDVIYKAHDYAKYRLGSVLQIPKLELCKPMLYVEDHDELGETGGIQLNFSVPRGFGHRIIGARVAAYYPGDPILRPGEVFTLSEAEEVERLVQLLNAVAHCATGLNVTRDLTGIVGIPRIPHYQAED